MSIEVMKMAIEALTCSEKDTCCRYQKGVVIDTLRQAIAEQTSHDIADIIAGALSVSRGTAYDMMHQAIEKQPDAVITKFKEKNA
jgi:hypothetical protein